MNLDRGHADIEPAGGSELVTGAPVDFGAHVRRIAAGGGLVVQPRMGFSDPAQMRAGLQAVKQAHPHTVGTITLDSYTRVGNWDALSSALAAGAGVNGYPILNYDAGTTNAMLDGIRDADFPVQVRHGSALALPIFRGLLELGLNATEGGPVSYCLPYGRTPLVDSVRSWTECVRRFSGLHDAGIEPHLETFGGCMLGQLCPPSQLIAISVLEAMFFCQNGIRSVSLSYAQQTNPEQDVEGLQALRRLAAELLPVPNWHVVVYAYMGVFPTTDHGSHQIMAQAVELAVRTGSERIIVKTNAESRRIPTIGENVTALRQAAESARVVTPVQPQADDSQTYREARALIEAVLNGPDELGAALLWAFHRGYLDIPYCVHPDNRGRTRSHIDGNGWLRWSKTGSLPIGSLVATDRSRTVTAAGLLADLSYVRNRYDGTAPAELEDARRS